MWASASAAPRSGCPAAQFADVFRRARDLGLHSVPHAGETTGPQTVRDGVELLGARRIGHGISAADDPALLALLVERGVALEVCPTSNLRTRAVATLAEHPFRRLLDAGVAVTLNTDDPGMFDTDLNREYLLAHEVFGLDRARPGRAGRRRRRASFAPAATRQALLAEIDAYAAAAGRLDGGGGPAQALDDVDREAAAGGLLVLGLMSAPGLAHRLDRPCPATTWCAPSPRSAMRAAVIALTAAMALRSMHGICTSPPTGSQVRPRLCSIAISAAFSTCSGVPPSTSASPPAAIEQAEPTSPWQPTSAPEIEAFSLYSDADRARGEQEARRRRRRRRPGTKRT